MNKKQALLTGCIFSLAHDLLVAHKTVHYHHKNAEIEEYHLPYSFYYETDDGSGNSNHRYEQSDPYKGSVSGSYGYLNEDGQYRTVYYFADNGGFKAQLKTNEPGTDNKNPADVEVAVFRPPVQKQSKYPQRPAPIIRHHPPRPIHSPVQAPRVRCSTGQDACRWYPKPSTTPPPTSTTTTVATEEPEPTTVIPEEMTDPPVREQELTNSMRAKSEVEDGRMYAHRLRRIRRPMNGRLHRQGEIARN